MVVLHRFGRQSVKFLIFLLAFLSTAFYIQQVERRFDSQFEHLTEKNQNDFFQSRVSLLRRPYPGKDCQNFSKRMMKEETFNLTALVSFPGSGNTWLRHLLELATGLYTGSMYDDLDLYGRGFLGEREIWGSGKTMIDKTHLEYSESLGTSRAVVLIREPYKAIVSFIQFLEGGHTGRASQITFKRNEWPRYMLGQTYRWIRLTKSWVESDREILIVFYENIKADATKELIRICSFLHLPCSFVNSLCFRKHKEGYFHRKQLTRSPPPFPNWVRGQVDDGIDFLNRFLIQNSHPPIPLHRYQFYKNPENSTAIQESNFI